MIGIFVDKIVVSLRPLRLNTPQLTIVVSIWNNCIQLRSQIGCSRHSALRWIVERHSSHTVNHHEIVTHRNNLPLLGRRVIKLLPNTHKVTNLTFFIHRVKHSAVGGVGNPIITILRHKWRCRFLGLLVSEGSLKERNMCIDIGFEINNILIIGRIEHALTKHTGHDAPLVIIEFLRLLQQIGNGVNLLIKIVFQTCIKSLLKTPIDETREPRVFPHAVDPVFTSTVAIVAHQLVFCIVGTTPIYTVIVVVSDVIVPQRSPVEQRILLILVEIGREKAINIAAHFGGNVPIDKRRRVHPTTIALVRISEIATPKHILKVLHVLPNIRILFPRDVFLIRIMNTDWHTIVRCGEIVAIIKAIDLQEITTRDVAPFR